MTCERARELIVDLDARAEPGPELARHLSGCAACRSLRDRLRRVEASSTLTSETTADAAHGLPPTSRDLTDRIMHAVTAEAADRGRVSPASAPASRPVGLRGWTVGGALILAGLVSIEFSDVVEWLRDAFGSVIDVALSTMLGIALTVYIMLLVGLNLRAVRRALRLPFR